MPLIRIVKLFSTTGILIGILEGCKKNLEEMSFMNFFKVNSVQEPCAKSFAVHLLKFEILQITWEKWNKEHQTHSFQFFSYRFWCFLFCFSCGLQDFKFWYVNRKAFGASFLYRVDFIKLNLLNFFVLTLLSSTIKFKRTISLNFVSFLEYINFK